MWCPLPRCDPGMRRDVFDVVVVGGGPAGIAAAFSAGRLGVKTLLLERAGMLGGNVGNALVHTICGLYASDSDRPICVQRGFPQAFCDALASAGGAGRP